MAREEKVKLEIVDIAHQGDGVAIYEGRKIFVPGALKGETVDAEIIGDRAEKVELIDRSEGRADPFCAYFGTCGGCALQHFNAENYTRFKLDQLIHTFRNRGIDVVPLCMISPPNASRRRASFSAIKRGKGVWLGFNARRSATIVPIDNCPLLVPQINAAMDHLRALAETVPGKKLDFDIQVTLADEGLDVAIVGLKTASKLARNQHRALIDIALQAGWARLCVDDEVLIEVQAPHITNAGLKVSLPPMPFLQPTIATEQHMVAHIMGALQNSRRIFDLFCGIGTFALPLARNAQVTAIDSNADAVAALLKTSTHTQSLKPLTATSRDLYRRPLSPPELNSADAVVFDPPRAGAQLQVESIAKSDIKTVVAVSCNMATMARDLRTLLDGGYELNSVQPVDQFPFTPHLEAISVLSRR